VAIVTIQDKIMNNNHLILIQQAIENGQLDLAEKLILQLKDTEKDLKEFYSGIICYKMQRWGDALNHFHKVEEMNPHYKEAKNYISMISDILKFYHKDLYNP